MVELVRRFLIRILRIPPEPAVVSYPGTTTRIFRAAPSYFTYAKIRWVIAQFSAVLGIGFALFWTTRIPESFGPVRTIVSGLEVLGIVLYLLQLPFTYLMIRFDYEFRWYIVTDRSLRIREGVRAIREMTMTFANIQNISSEQGPIQRYFGIANLKVQTAGGGAIADDPSHDLGESMHVGYFRGVDNVEEIKSLILDRLRKLKDSGLGDPDDARATAAQQQLTAVLPAAEEDIRAAELLLQEVRGLRSALISAQAPGATP
jgi:membrane protein YdbS with pleckstrin-like domain